MASNRIGRINEEIQRELSALIRTVKDPRVHGLVSITAVDTAPDLRYAKVYVSMLDKSDVKEVVKGLKSASGYLRRELGQALQLRYTPELTFVADDSIAEGAQAHLLGVLPAGHLDDQSALVGAAGGVAQALGDALRRLHRPAGEAAGGVGGQEGLCRLHEKILAAVKVHMVPSFPFVFSSPLSYPLSREKATKNRPWEGPTAGLFDRTYGGKVTPAPPTPHPARPG